jgi:hypothetical protein
MREPPIDPLQSTIKRKIKGSPSMISLSGSSVEKTTSYGCGGSKVGTKETIAATSFFSLSTAYLN